MVRLPFRAVSVTLAVTCAVASGLAGSPLDGVSFASRPGTLYVPLRSAAEELGLSVEAASGEVFVNGRRFNGEAKKLPDGTTLVPVRAFEEWGASVTWNLEAAVAELSLDGAEISVRQGEKRVIVDKSRQVLRALQGKLTVLKTPVSTGGPGHRTPVGKFTAGPYKATMHRSSLYNDAEMPYSIQIIGNIFVHGYESVPDQPASHGCIRVPLDGSASFLYDWIDVGTPITIKGQWQG